MNETVLFFATQMLTDGQMDASHDPFYRLSYSFQLKAELKISTPLTLSNDVQIFKTCKLSVL